jgi:hypothetical protein
MRAKLKRFLDSVRLYDRKKILMAAAQKVLLAKKEINYLTFLPDHAPRTPFPVILPMFDAVLITARHHTSSVCALLNTESQQKKEYIF